MCQSFSKIYSKLLGYKDYFQSVSGKCLKYIDELDFYKRLNDLKSYLSDVNDVLIKGTNNKFWFLGRRAAENLTEKMPTNFKPFPTIKDLLEVFDDAKLTVVHEA